MAVLMPIPDTLASYPIRPDFPDEAGFTEGLRWLIRPNDRGEVSPAMRGLLPPNLSAADYHRIADWAELPQRVAYYETNGDGVTTLSERPIGVLLANGTALLMPETRIWDELNRNLVSFTAAPVDAAGFPPWFTPLGASSKMPDRVILHDRALGRGFIVKAEEVSQYLGQHLTWNVPA